MLAPTQKAQEWNKIMGHEASLVPDILPPGRRIALIDIDGTLTEGLTISSFAEYLDNNDSFNSSSWDHMQEDFSRYSASDHGHAAYEQFAVDLVLHYADGLRDYRVSDVEAMAGKFFVSVQRNEVPEYRVYPFSPQLVHLMNKIGTTIAVSGSPAESLAPLKRILNLGDLRATAIGQKNGIYTGRVDINLALDSEKKKVVGEYIAEDTDSARSFAFGDTMHDLPMLEAVGNPFVVGDNSHLLAVARRRGWSIINSDNAIDQVAQRINTLFKNT
ncbi:MAG: HAD-IB family phosphatase [Candidatus Levybacteria bacterium]|nr:HAD-IB family phosphatase [Candidatus Levybacteria bacterium]